MEKRRSCQKNCSSVGSGIDKLEVLADTQVHKSMESRNIPKSMVRVVQHPQTLASSRART